MSLIEKIEQGKIEGLGMPEKVIETLFSKLFFFKDRVIKFYLHKKDFFGDFDQPAFRKEFYAEDFYWNHTMSPEIYLRLVHIEDDFYIEMKRIDGAKNLTNLLSKDEVTVSQIQAMTHLVVEKMRVLTKTHKTKLQKVFNRGWYKIQREDIEDIRSWIYLADQYIPRKVVDEIVDFLNERTDKEEYFTKHDPALLSVALDVNSDNLLILDGKPSAIDVMLPKENWRVRDEYYNIVRIATDSEVLAGRELSKAVYETYFNTYKKEIPPKAVTLIYEIRDALLQWPYRHVLNQHETAEKFKTFLFRKIDELKKLQD